MIKETFSPEETFAFGKWIGENALPGQVYTLVDRKSTRLNSSHSRRSRMPSSA